MKLSSAFRLLSFTGIKQWMYHRGRPNWLAALLNRGWAWIHALGVAPNYLVTLEVRGHKSGRTITLPLVMVLLNGERYLVSMLGADATWVRNVQAAGGQATLIHGRRELVRLAEIPPAQRPPILKLYLQRAPGARPHLPVHKDAPLADFALVAAQFPVFRVVTEPAK